MKNEYGQLLDSNGYAPSIMETKSGERCCECGNTLDLIRHEPLCGVKIKRKSARLGLWVTLCANCHAKKHRSGILQMRYRRYAQQCACFYYDWSKEDFIKEFGRSYL